MKQFAELIKKKDLKGIKQLASQYNTMEQVNLLKVISHVFYDMDDHPSGIFISDLAYLNYLIVKRDNAELEQDLLLQLGKPNNAEYTKKHIERLDVYIDRETQRLDL